MSDEDDEFTPRDAALSDESMAEEEELPDEIRGWNWGAFFLNWIWGIGNRTYIALAMFIPVINIFMPFVLGFKGNKWAWRNKEWEDVDHFLRVQRRWSVVGVSLFLMLIFSSLGGLVWVQKYLARSEPVRLAIEQVLSSQAVIDRLGGRIRPGWYVLGNFEFSGGTGVAHLNFPINGPRGEADVYLNAVQENDRWGLVGLEVAVGNDIIPIEVPRQTITRSLDEGVALIDAGDGRGAIDALMPAARLQNADAQRLIGEIYAVGLGVDVDLDQSKSWLERAVANGSRQARDRLAEVEEMRPPDPTPEQLRQMADEEKLESIKMRLDAAEIAIDDLRELAESGSPEAQVYFADLLFAGSGIDRNLSLSAMWYKRAAEQGHVEAQFMLGSMYVRGNAVPRSIEDAREWLTKAAEQGHEGARNELRVVGDLAVAD
ncbi:MAG: cytochrome c oxidase assembly factor Coa1 family protein [Rhodospirillales bacterium]